MAIAKRGPLVGEIRGSVAGVTFQGGQTDQFIRAKIAPCNRRSAYQNDARGLMAQGSTAWAGLTEAVREGWRVACGGDRKGYMTYIAAWMAQAGASTIEAPPIPARQVQPEPMRLQVVEDHDDLMLVGFDRNLASTEEAIVRVYKQVPRTWSRTFKRTKKYIDVPYLGGLGLTPYRVQNIPNSEGSYANYNGTTTPGTTWTMELWIRPDSAHTSGTVALWSQTPNLGIFYWRISSRIRWYVNGAYVNLGNPLPDDEWYYVVLRSDGTAGTVDLWINGELYGAPINAVPIQMIGEQRLGYRIGYANLRYAGRMGPVQISNSVRSEAYIVDRWNEGKGKPYFYDGLTETLLEMEEQTGATLADSSPFPTDWTRTALGTAYGPWCRTIYSAAEREMSQGRVNTMTRIKDLTKRPGQPWPDRWDY